MASSPTPAATAKISSSSQRLKWLRIWMAKNISAASVMAVTTYHRRQPGCRTIHAASRLSTPKLPSRTTNDQSKGGRLLGSSASRVAMRLKVKRAAATKLSDMRALADWKAGWASLARSQRARR